MAVLALRLLCAATFVPRAARQLSHESGLIPWLAAAAEAAIQGRPSSAAGGSMGSSTSGGAGSLPASAAQPGEALSAPLAALRRLLQLRAVMRGPGGAGAAQQMAAAAQQLAAAALAAAAGRGGGGLGGVAAEPGSEVASVCQQLLPFLQEVQQHLGGSSSQGAGHRHPYSRRQLGASLAGVTAAAHAVDAVLAEQPPFHLSHLSPPRDPL